MGSRRASAGLGHGDRPVDVLASAAGASAALVTAAAIFFGSMRLRTFDVALVGYATATVFLAFGVAYRYVVWVRSPPAMRYLRRGWQSFLSFRNFRRFPTLVPRAVVLNLALQTFIASRGRGRWLAHQSVFWGVVLATLITFPLTFGWISFEAAGTGSRYAIVVWGFDTITFDPVTWLGWLIFHALDIAAVLVVLGCAYFLWRRFRNREATTAQRLGYDFLPLIALVAISMTGLLLTLSSALLEGEGYEFLAIIHMATVVLTLVFIPFGKFFHVIQRPASVGVELYKRTSMEREGVFPCRRCGEPVETVTFVKDLEATMAELDLPYGDWVQTCPRCKRIARGQAYLGEVNRGFG
ncbi:MAG TPA: MFS transporter [Actinomycetota bacterium]|nr:MFS transporter [Actinomycetota bacterium]